MNTGGTGTEMDGASSADAAEVPEVARQVFGDRLPAATWYAEFLGSQGVLRGVIGPREVDRLWDRHILNCAVIADLIPPDSRVLDVGSGAGLPGLVLALVRPDLEVTLLDAQARRVEFLSECIRTLTLSHVEVRQGRVEEDVTRRVLGDLDVVTARAVAPLDRLARWCLPVLRSSGHLLAIKGASASDEVARHRKLLGRYGASEVVIRQCGTGIVRPETIVVDIEVG
jgi:16S rRNA (guanine527-N7)-methyltransferase